ncbi:MAG: GNAT family N-acetyltransferase [Phycisphaeraceae bacterium]|nr:GNAT family N-acetyltransferase [Phycisphaeraceae bacterium]MCW5767555.1 GNAT family N-acetyltransferase [Phycisphaeraceae bacterium]
MTEGVNYAVRRDGFLISSDPALLDLDVVHGFLSTCYWSPGIPRATIERALAHSLSFGLYETSGATPGQIGFARVITDRATFAYLCDVFVLDAARGRGLGTWLIESVLAHPDLHGLRRFCLLTRDAHTLYARFGFKPMPDPSRYMEVWNPNASIPRD